MAEQEDGYVIVASEDIHLTAFRNMAQGFAVTVHGSATIAEVHTLFDDPHQTDRLGRILSDQLLASWGYIEEDQLYIVDVGIACAGTQEIPPRPVRGKRATDAQWAAKEYEWSERRASAYNEWDDIKIERETSIQKFTEFYQAEILHMRDSADFDAGVLPDSFTVRLKISGKGLKDFVLNYPYIFEVVELEDIALPQHHGQQGVQAATAVAPVAPAADAPAVCVIDSGIQEAHVMLQPASTKPLRIAFCRAKPRRPSPMKSRQVATARASPGQCFMAKKFRLTAHRNCRSGFRTLACSTLRTRCQSSCSLPRRCERR